LQSEALAPDVPDELTEDKANLDRIMGKQAKVSTNGYPQISQNQRNVIYDSVQLNARRRSSSPIVFELNPPSLDLVRLRA
jgi:hypothetical protein